MADAAATTGASPFPRTDIHATVILLCGLPASGKSQLARQVCEYYADHFDDVDNNTPTICHHVEYDLLEQMQYDLQEQKQHHSNDNGKEKINESDETNFRLRLQAWQQSRDVALKQLKRHLDLDCFLHWNYGDATTSSTSRLPKLVILMDDNFHLRGMRKQVHRLLWELQRQHQDKNETQQSCMALHFGTLHVNTPIEICRQRNRKREPHQIVSDNVLEKLERTIEVPPESPSMYWEECWKTVETTSPSPNNTEDPDSDDELLKDVVQFIESCLPIFPVQVEDDEENEDEAVRKEMERNKTRTNSQHNHDKMLRHYVSTVAQFDKTFAKAANTARKELLQELKNKNEQEEVTPKLLVELFVDLVVLHQVLKRKNGHSEQNAPTLKSTLCSLLMDTT